MKKLVSVLLVLTMVLALAGTAMAACKISKYTFVTFTKDANAYTAAKSSKKTNNVVQKGSRAWCTKVCGDYARLIVNEAQGTQRWFKISALKEEKDPAKHNTRVIWAKGGKGMSRKTGVKAYESSFKGKRVFVTGHTNLRKTPSPHLKSQGVVEDGDLLKLTGWYAVDNRLMAWWEVCYKGKKLWVSENFILLDASGFPLV